jgi:hypothetical protein
MSTDVSEGTALMMESARTSVTSVDIDLRQYIPEDSELHIRRRENLKSNKLHFVIYRYLISV